MQLPAALISCTGQLKTASLATPHTTCTAHAYMSRKPALNRLHQLTCRFGQVGVGCFSAFSSPCAEQAMCNSVKTHRPYHGLPIAWQHVVVGDCNQDHTGTRNSVATNPQCCQHWHTLRCCGGTHTTAVRLCLQAQHTAASQPLSQCSGATAAHSVCHTPHGNAGTAHCSLTPS